jgi:hypothetical protein
MKEKVIYDGLHEVATEVEKLGNNDEGSGLAQSLRCIANAVGDIDQRVIADAINSSFEKLTDAMDRLVPAPGWRIVECRFKEASYIPWNTDDPNADFTFHEIPLVGWLVGKAGIQPMFWNVELKAVRVFPGDEQNCVARSLLSPMENLDELMRINLSIRAIPVDGPEVLIHSLVKRSQELRQIEKVVA